MIRTYFPNTVFKTMTTSLLFITNTIHLSYKQDVLYYHTFACLTILSILYHLTKNKTIGILDKTCVSIIVWKGSHILLHTEFDKYSMVVITTASSVTWLFYYGLITQTYVYDKDPYIGNNYHMLLHILSSIGHHAVAYKIK